MDNKKEFKPFIPADKVMPEFTVASVIIGLILAVIFGAANAYLGVRVGMTVSASIPAAVISMGVIRVIMKKDSILENNMVQTIGSAGESLAAGAVFTLPAIFMWAKEGKATSPSFITITLIALCGGILGVLFMVPLRTALIVEEHGTLPYPEGTACAEVLLAGEEGGSKSKLVFSGLGISAVYKFIADGLCLFPSEVDFSFKGSYTCAVGMDVLPALSGVGYICGPKVSSYLFAGGILSYLVLMPAIAFFGGDSLSSVADDAGNLLPFNQLDPGTIWSKYIRYIGAGAVAAGGIISLIKTLPTMFRTFKSAIKGFGKNVSGGDRTQQDLPMSVVLIGSLVIAVGIWLIPEIPVSLLGALLIVVFGFFFATVSSRMVGIVGSSNNPVSGMAIATLILTSFVLKATGSTGSAGMIAAISIGTVICIIAAMAGDTSQDLKTGYIVGATPVKQQIGELLGAVVAALTIGGVLYILSKAWGGFGSAQLPAPQASLMKMVVEGVMGGTLPWVLIIVGAFIAIVVEILGIPVLAFSIGLYLPIYLSTPIMVGGVIKWFIDNKRKYANDEERKDASDRGVLYAAGMIAGEGIVGIVLAILAVVNVADKLNLSSLYGESGAFQTVGNWVGLIAFVLLLSTLFHFTKGKKTIEVDAKEK